MLTLYGVRSICVPIALVAGFAAGRRTAPWLGRWGLAITRLLFVLGAAASTAFTLQATHFVASGPQLGVTVGLGFMLVGAGLWLRPAARRPARDRTGRALAVTFR